MTRKKTSPRQLPLAGFDEQRTEVAQTDSNDSNTKAALVSESSTEQTTHEDTSPQASAERKPLVILVDSHSLIYQVFHAMPTMTAPDGTEVGAIHGFFRDLIDLKSRFAPDYLICCFDLSENTFRNEIFDQYKANREPMPAALHAQVEKIRSSMETLGIPSLGVPGYEADDLLATIANDAEKKGYQVLLVTSDKDCRQLLSDDVKMLNMRKGTTFGVAELMDDWGIRPDQVVDFQSMVGDSVDNVPGVPKIGPKAAKELLNEYGSLDKIYERLDQVSGAARKATLQEHRDKAYLSKSLVALDCNVPLEMNWSGWRQPTTNRADLEKLFQELGFRRLAERFLADASLRTEQTLAPKTSSVNRSQYRCIDSYQKLLELKLELTRMFAGVSGTQVLSVDTETTSPSPAAADLAGIALAWEGAAPVYIPVKGPTNQADRVLALDAVQQQIGPILADPSIQKVGQNLKYDLIVLRNHGFVVTNIAFDTMIADYLCSPGDRNHSLDELSKRNLDHDMIPITALIGSGKDQITIDQVDLDRVTEYAAEDADVALQLVSIMQEKLNSMELQSVFTELEMPLIDVLAQMEQTGIAVDVPTLQTLHDQFERRIEQLKLDIYRTAGHEFNADSPKQLAQVLFEELGLRVVKRTKNGPSTDVEVLQELADEHPLPALIIEHRQMTKLKSTYVDSLPKLINPKTSRVHTSYRQDVAATGRLSSSDPNLQNIPIRTEEGRRIRSAFRPGFAGWTLLAADYSQIELRMMAHYCDDPTLKEAFYQNEDIHAAVAAQVYNVDRSEVSSNQRRIAKAINFGILYGQSPFGLAKVLGIGKNDAADFIDEYFAKFSNVRQFMLSTLQQARRDGYVATMSGRRRYLNGIRDFSKLNSQQQKTLLEPERMAVNTVIQGSAADLIKIAMIRVAKRLKSSSLRANLLLQIHDELLFEVDPADLPQLTELVHQEMTQAVQLSVPLAVDVKTGMTWADC